MGDRLSERAEQQIEDALLDSDVSFGVVALYEASAELVLSVLLFDAVEPQDAES